MEGPAKRRHLGNQRRRRDVHQASTGEQLAKRLDGNSISLRTVPRIGDSNTWLVSTDGAGAFWRTTDASATWTHLDGSLSGLHGQASLYYAKTGVVYSGAAQYPIRSTDNGVTWAHLSSLPYNYYMSVMGDGNYLYTLKSGAIGGGALPSPGPDDQPYATSPESDGKTWSPYRGGAQKFGNGPLVMAFDPVNRVMYSANWQWGIWALKVVDP